MNGGTSLVLCERILGNIGDDSVDSEYDFVEFSWDECIKRALRKRTTAGRELKILLPIGSTIREGDVLVRGETEGTVVARVLPCEVIVATPADAREMALLALEVGNLHAPAEVTAAGELVVLPDGPVEELLKRLAVPSRIERRQFTPVRGGPAGNIRFAESFQIERK